MWTSLEPIKVLRYLLVWRVNRSLVQLPPSFAADLSLVLGTIIADRLPTRKATPWRKALARRETLGASGNQTGLVVVPEAPWPLETVVLVYPGKRTYGQGEPILWELKLFGASADHGLFLETILPALEEGSYTTDPRWHVRNTIWGRFDIQAVYVARGRHWEPLVRDGRLDLRYRPSATQWADGLTLGAERAHPCHRLTWVTPFDFDGMSADKSDGNSSERPAGTVFTNGPTLRTILNALLSRLGCLIPDRPVIPEDGRDALISEGPLRLQEAMQAADDVLLRSADLERVPDRWPGQWRGTQVFASIPALFFPSLQLASILHIGRQTHFGCGTFVLS
jgi:hypothetical protein